QLCFETLTFAPFDRRLILADRLSGDERNWLNTYHAEVLAKLAPRLGAAARDWLQAACAPL
ncbi:MAG: M24 family metallopeptidase C-terminal domain-containing protein, partial [Rhodobacteraceae bacterium]|nr:M24 family metallopeptidase C-terminal domain-containing protein [Paracoccaceae bacterium]